MTAAGARPAVVLLSGGLDSAVALAWAVREGFAPVALTFDYGQRHRLEVDGARRVARAAGVRDHRVVAIDLRAVGGSALTSEIEVPKSDAGAGTAPGIPVTYVPARNLAFLAVAAGLAEVLGASDLVVGVNAVDYSGYPDCRREFIDAFERAAKLGTRRAEGGPPIRVHTPLVSMRKSEIILLGVTLGVDLSITHSCYDPAGGGACGRCESCRIRRRGFEEAGVPDPTRYAPDGASR